MPLTTMCVAIETLDEVARSLKCTFWYWIVQKTLFNSCLTKRNEGKGSKNHAVVENADRHKNTPCAVDPSGF